MSGSTTSRHGAPSGTAERSSTAWRAPFGTRPGAITIRTASVSSAVRSLKVSTMSAASSTVTWTPRCGSRRSMPSEISTWVAARNEWRAMPQALGELRLAQAAAGLELAVEDQLAQHVGGRVDGRDGVQMQVAGRAGTVLRSFHVLHSSTIRQLRFCAILSLGRTCMRITCENGAGMTGFAA